MYLVSLSVMGTCSGLSTAARTGDSQSFKPKVKNSFLWGSPDGRWVEGGKKGRETWHVEFCIMLMVWDYINEIFFCCFPCCR